MGGSTQPVKDGSTALQVGRLTSVSMITNLGTDTVQLKGTWLRVEVRVVTRLRWFVHVYNWAFALQKKREATGKAVFLFRLSADHLSRHLPEFSSDAL
jgi:hypothetical protein